MYIKLNVDVPLTGEKAEVMNILAEGVEMLKKPLNEYNEAFKTLQARRRRQPLIRRYHRKQSGPTQSSSVSPQQDSNETQTEIARAADDDSEDVVWDDTYPIEEEVDTEILPCETEEDFELYAD
ncbi:hypothetical protein K474DRAFT_133418 [Panus rudis PR-1116 ss-1]|nr:hypothetical protein K474DRAFT_133418 [Panus rudis PR-1116 ss-1]